MPYDVFPSSNRPLKHRQRTPFEWAVMLIGCQLAVVNLGLGAALTISDPARTSAASFNVLKQLMPMSGYGWLFIGTGLVAVVAQVSWRLGLVTAMHALAGLVCVFWSVAFSVAAAQAPTASVTGVWAYFGLGLTHWVIAGVTAVAAWDEHQNPSATHV